MKKIIICLLLALLMSFAQPQEMLSKVNEYRTSIFIREEKAQETPFMQELAVIEPATTLDVTLYFRFMDSSLLGAQRMELDILRDETVARGIVDALIEGPDGAHSRLNGLFPQGTQVLSVSGDETTIFVTLSSEFLGRPDGAPADWEDSDAWQEEAATRRLLAAQSLVLSLTENALCQRVQLYVAGDDDDLPRRIPLWYFDWKQTDVSSVLTACGRDEGFLLTPEHLLRMALDSWKCRDWSTLHSLLTATGAESLPDADTFARLMERRAISLLEYSVSSGSVSLSGDRATLVMNARIRSDEGGEALIERESVPLVRVEDNWMLPGNALEKLMIRD